MEWCRKWLFDFNVVKTQLVLFGWPSNTGAIDVKIDGSVHKEKLSFKMLRLYFSSKLDWYSYIISIAKTAAKEIGALIHSWSWPYSWSILTPEVSMYHYKSTIWPCMECCCHVWSSAFSCYLELLDKLQKWTCMTVSPSLAAFLEPLAHCQNVARLSLFYSYYFDRCSSELTQVVQLPYSWGRFIRYSDRLHDFSFTVVKCYKDIYVNVFYPCTASLRIICL